MKFQNFNILIACFGISISASSEAQWMSPRAKRALQEKIKTALEEQSLKLSKGQDFSETDENLEAASSLALNKCQTFLANVNPGQQPRVQIVNSTRKVKEDFYSIWFRTGRYFPSGISYGSNYHAAQSYKLVTLRHVEYEIEKCVVNCDSTTSTCEASIKLKETHVSEAGEEIDVDYVCEHADADIPIRRPDGRVLNYCSNADSASLIPKKKWFR